MNKDVRFGGTSCDQVIIEQVDPDIEPTISLLDPLHEDLLTIRPNPDGVNSLIGSVQRVYVRGWGTTLISNCLTALTHDESKPNTALTCKYSKQNTTMQELHLVCCAFALMIATHLRKDDSGRLKLELEGYASESFLNRTSDIPCHTDPSKVIMVANILFDDAHIAEKDVKPYRIAYSSRALKSSDLPIPITFEAASESLNFSHKRTANIGGSFAAFSAN